ncbi:hypothetical protein TNCV_2865611 [Trichonephila clavipes]|nr:hypothetical protein TNCV_2865611 [Trichonephila clavipes]
MRFRRKREQRQGGVGVTSRYPYSSGCPGGLHLTAFHEHFITVAIAYQTSGNSPGNLDFLQLSGLTSCDAKMSKVFPSLMAGDDIFL